MNGIDAITVNNLDAAVSLLRRLGKPEWANELIAAFIAIYHPVDDSFRPQDPIEDDALNDALRAKVKADLPLPEPIEVLRRIAQDRSWGKRDELSLTQVTIDQFVHIFKTLPATPELGDIVRSALLFKNMQGASADLSRVSANAEQALRIIAGESELNRLRIQRFGIPLEQNEARAADQNSG